MAADIPYQMVRQHKTSTFYKYLKKIPLTVRIGSGSSFTFITIILNKTVTKYTTSTMLTHNVSLKWVMRYSRNEVLHKIFIIVAAAYSYGSYKKPFELNNLSEVRNVESWKGC